MNFPAKYFSNEWFFCGISSNLPDVGNFALFWSVFLFSSFIGTKTVCEKKIYTTESTKRRDELSFCFYNDTAKLKMTALKNHV